MPETNQKIEPTLRAALDATTEELAQSPELATGFTPSTRTWEVILRHTGTAEDLIATLPDAHITPLLGNYAIARLPQEQIDTIAALPQIIYIEKPKRLFFEVQQARAASCITSLQNTNPTAFTGQGVLVAVIDSGIDYAHPDFRNDDGTSRIMYLWDQTIPQTTTSPTSFPTKSESSLLSPNTPGTLYDNTLLNQALASPTIAQRQEICPSIDISGHGTHVAGIAAGNGRASDGIFRGVAYEADLLIVKLGASDPLGFPNTSQLMMAVDFCIRISIELQKPLAINLSFGNTYGSHSGTSLLETYLDTAAQSGQICIAAGSGNEGASAGHTGGRLSPNSSTNVQFIISEFLQNLSIQIWKNYWDEMLFSITSPAGQSITFSSTPGAWRYTLEHTELYLYIGEPSPYNIFQEIYIDFLPQSTYLDAGIWTILIQGQKITDGIWDMWMPASAVRGTATQFLLPTADTTLTIPSTSGRLITVGAYDSNRLTGAPFSGRGYTWNLNQVKPDLVAPGVDITSCAPGGGYAMRTGTSMAAPFVTGSCAALMQWGILLGNDLFLYGDKVKAHLIRGARPLPFAESYPNPEIGWGALCLRDSVTI